MIIGPWVRTAGLTAVAVAAVIQMPANGSTTTKPAQDRPPECVTVKVVNTNDTRTWITACGSGPGRESPLADFANGKRLITDGAFLVGKGCGWHAQPCVLFPLFATPKS